jgi:hypothetical protein
LLFQNRFEGHALYEAHIPISWDFFEHNGIWLLILGITFERRSKCFDPKSFTNSQRRLSDSSFTTHIYFTFRQESGPLGKKPRTI